MHVRVPHRDRALQLASLEGGGEGEGGRGGVGGVGGGGEGGGRG